MRYTATSYIIYISDVQNTVKNMITSSEICQKRKTLKHKTKECTLELGAIEHLDKINVDICGAR